jgi:hypothetical protein
LPRTSRCPATPCWPSSPLMRNATYPPRALTIRKTRNLPSASFHACPQI